MRSPRTFAGSVVVLAGIALALVTALTIGAGAELIVHLALGVGFALIAAGAFDFRVPAPVKIAAAVLLGIFAAIFLLQAVANVVPAEALQTLAFDILGQRLERYLGYAFLAWCIVLVVLDSEGMARALGVAAVSVALAAEAYTAIAETSGGEAPAALRLLSLLLFAWLALLARQPRAS